MIMPRAIDFYDCILSHFEKNSKRLLITFEYNYVILMKNEIQRKKPFLCYNIDQTTERRGLIK